MAKLSEEEKAQRALKRRQTAALAAEEDAVRHAEKRREWDEKGMHLTQEELMAGAPCRGCGLPVIDGLGDWPVLMKVDEDQRREYEAVDADFSARHPDCRTARWSMSGSRATHCCLCCPPPPLSDEQVEKVRTIFVNSRRPDPAELDTWRLTLTCDHVLEKTQHASNSSWTGSVADCPSCGQVRGIVISERLAPNPARYAAEHRRLNVELDKARAEHERCQKKADAGERRIKRLKNELLDLGSPSRQA